VAGHRLFAAIYDTMNRPLEHRVLAEHRARLVADLPGTVLDIGAGTGANLRHFRTAGQVYAVEPDPAMRARLAANLTSASVPADITDAPAEDLPFPDNSADAIVYTLVLCSVTDPARALAEARRVLKPGGQLAILEHVRGSGRLARWQDHLTPVCTRLAAGCHPNRDTRTTIEEAGFTLDHIETFEPVPRFVPIRPWLHATATLGN
jgi:ubiquinone/menaquinone biosynthesis C-methylase UbiE